MYDAFLSYASEDKESVAKPLAIALLSGDLSIWYDEFELSIGDSLVRSIDRGLASCRYGIVILSPNFFAKRWPQRELDGLVAREVGESSEVILPVWHNLGPDDVRRYSPTLAGKLGLPTSLGIEEIAALIVKKIKARSGTSSSYAVAETSPKLTIISVKKQLSLRGFTATVKFRLRVEHELQLEQKPALPTGQHIYVAVDNKVVVRERTRPIFIPASETFTFTVEDVKCELILKGIAGLYYLQLYIGGEKIPRLF